MQNSASTILALIVAGVLLFIVPVVTLTDRSDNVTQENVKLIVEQFVTEVRNTGKITRAQFQDFRNELEATGNISYNIDIELKFLDENPGKKTAQANYTKIGENLYYSEYTTQVLKRLGIKSDDQAVNSTDDTIFLKEGDYISVQVKNDDKTPAQTVKSSLFRVSNSDEYVIYAQSSGMVTVNGEKD